jgi:WD40 repeat protein
VFGSLNLIVPPASASPPQEPAGDKQPGAGPQTPNRTDRNGDPLPPDAIARIGSFRLRHVGGVSHLAFVPGSRLLASSGDDGIIRLWELPTGREVRGWNVGLGPGSNIALAATNRLLACTGPQNSVLVWDVATGKRRQVLAGHPQGVAGLALAPRGDLLATAGGDRTVCIWDVATGQPKLRLKANPQPIYSVAFSPDGKTLATGGAEETVRLWSIATGQEIGRFSGHAPLVSGVAFAPDGKSIVTVGKDHMLRLWNVANSQEIRRFEGREWAAFCPDGKILVGSRHGDIHLWDAATGKELNHFDPSGTIEVMAISPDGKTLATASRHDSEIHLWRLPDGQELHPYEGPRSAVHAFALSPDGKTLATASSDGSARLWDLKTGKELHTFRPRRAWVWSLALSPDGSTLAAGTMNDGVHLWDLATWEHRDLMGKPGGRVNSVVFSPDGRMLASAGPDEPDIHIWDLTVSKELRQVRTSGMGTGLTLAFAPDGNNLAYNDNGSIVLMEAATGRSLRTSAPFARPGARIAFAPDGKVVAARGQEAFHFWDVATGREHRPLKVIASTGSDIAFSPDGRMVAMFKDSGTIRLVELATGQERRRFKGHQGPVFALSFSADGKFLVTGSADATALVWDVTGSLAAKNPAAVSLSPRQLSDLWTALAEAPTPEAYQAICTLAHAPDQAVSFLRDHLRPVVAVLDDRIPRLIRELDSNKFAVRNKAMTELTKLGDLAEPALQEALETQPTLEVRRRVERLLDILNGTVPSPEQLRSLRAVEALEMAGNLEAQQLLRSLAKGAPGARLTNAAGSAVERLQERQTRLARTAQPPSEHHLAKPVPAGPPERTDRFGDPLPAGALARLGTVRFRANSYVGLVALLGGKVIATGGEGARVYLWDASTGKELRQLGNPTNRGLRALATSPDGLTLAVADGAQKIRLWDAATGKLNRELEVEDDIMQGQSLALAPDGKTLAVALLRTVDIVDVATGKVVKKLPAGSIPKAVVFSPDGRQLATGGLDMLVRLWDVGTYEEPRLLVGHTKAVETLAFSPDSRILASAGAAYPDGRLHPPSVADNAIRLWDAATGKELRRCEGHARGVYAIAFSPDGKLLASGGTDGPVRLWDVATGRLARACESSPNHVQGVAFMPDGKTLITGGPTIQLWDPATGQERLVLDAHQDRVGAFEFSADGTVILSASADRTIRYWETATGRQLRRVPLNDFRDRFTFTPDGKLLITGDHDGALRLWDAANGKAIRQLEGHRGPIYSLAVSPDSTLLASGGGWFRLDDRPTDDYAIRLWDLATGKKLLQIEDHRGSVGGLRFSPDCKTLVSASQDHTVRLWDLATGTEIRRFGDAQYISDLAFSPDGKILATGSQNQAILWDPVTGKELARLGDSKGWGITIAFSSDGRVVALGNAAGSLQLWELISRQEIARFVVPPGGVGAMRFSADGRLLVSQDREHNLLVWDVTGQRSAGGPDVPVVAAEELGRLWQELADPDSRRAQRAAWTLVAPGQPALSWIQEHLPAVQAADSPGADLPLQEPVTQPEMLQQLRAVAVVERIGGPAAREVLASLAKGSAQARLTREAKVAVERLANPNRIAPSIRPRPAALEGTAGLPREPLPPEGPPRKDLQGEPLPAGALARLGSTHWQPGDYVSSLAYAPDGTVVVSAGRNICVWDAATGRERLRFGYELSGTVLIAITPDSRMLVQGLYDGTLRLWDLATGKLVRTIANRCPRLYAVALSPDGKTLVVAGEQRDLRFWEVATGKETRRLAAGPLRNTAVAFSPDGRTLASVGDDGVLRLWAMPEAKEVRRFKGFTGGVAFAPDGKTLVAFAGGATIHLLEVDSGRDIRQMINEGPNRVGMDAPLFFSPDGKRLVSGSGYNGRLIHSWDVATGEQQPPIETQQGEIRAVAFSPDGKVLVSAGGIADTLRRWDLKTRMELPPPSGHRAGVTTVAFAEGGKQVITGSGGRTFWRWDSATERELGHFGTKEFRGRAAFSLTPDGRLAATLGMDGLIVVWDVATGKPLHELREAPGTDVYTLALSPDGKTLVSGDFSRPPRLWEVATGNQRLITGKPVGHLSFCPPVFSPDGKLLAAIAGGGDSIIVLWDATKGEELRRMGATNGDFRSLAFSPDGRTLASGGGDVYLWEVATGKERCRFPGGGCVALSPDGRILATASEDHTIHVWDWLTGQERVRFAGHRGWVECLAFDSDGRRLLSGSRDNTALVWDVAAQLKRAAPPGVELSRGELAGLWTDLADEDTARAYRAQRRLAAAPRDAIPLLRGKLHPPASAPQLQMGRALEVLEQIGTGEARQVLEDLTKAAPEAWQTQQAQTAVRRLIKRPSSRP